MSMKLLLGIKKLKNNAEYLLSFSVLKNFAADVVRKFFYELKTFNRDFQPAYFPSQKRFKSRYSHKHCCSRLKS